MKEFNLQEEKGLIWIGDRNRPDAYLSYTVDYHNQMAIRHTVVQKELEGQGIAKLLTEKAIEVARREGYTIDPICSYARHYFRKYPEHKDLVVK